MKLRIAFISLLLAGLCAGIGFFLYNSIHSRWYEKVSIKKTEEQIKEKLEIIREAEKAYYSVNQRYCGNWDSLTTFLLHGEVYVVERSEKLIPLFYYDGSPKGDSVVVKLDTLGAVAVKDSLFSPKKYPNLHIPTLRKVPHPEKSDIDFELYAGTVDNETGLKLQVFEAKDPAPINPERISNEGQAAKKQPLSIGSRNKSSLKGSWEK